MNTTSTYTAILETGYRLFAEHGFEKTSMAMIAKEVGITKPALYYHFVSKEAMIDVLFEEIRKRIGFSNFFKIGDYTKDNFVEKLVSDGLAVINGQRTDEHYSRIMNQYQALGYRNPDYSRKLLEILEGFTAGFVGLLRHGALIGAIDDKDTRMKAQMMTMTIDSMDNFISYGFDYDYGHIWAKTVKAIVQGDAV